MFNLSYGDCIYVKIFTTYEIFEEYLSNRYYKGYKCREIFEQIFQSKRIAFFGILFSL